MTGDYFGLPTTIITSPQLTLEFLSQAGPRIVRLFFGGSKENLLKEAPGESIETAYGNFHFRGGHRLWHAPESMPRSYLPDDGGLVVEKTDQGARLTGPVEAASGIQKCIEICMHREKPFVTLKHSLVNHGIWPVELAPWAITQLPLGGLAILPQTTTALDKKGLLPNRQLVLWPYTSWEDPRLQLHDDFILIKAEGKTPPLKVGYANRAGWAGYLRNATLFCKKNSYEAGAAYPDFDSSSECYCDNRFIELETLGPITRLEPGQATQHIETWELYPAPGIADSREDIAGFVRSLGLA
jgi:hypothetical protein